MPQADPIHIRQGLPEDSRLLCALGRRTFDDSFGADNHPSDMAAYIKQAFSPQIQAAELADPKSHVLIAETGDEAVGYARLAERAAPPGLDAQRPIKLVRLYAVKEWIGRGVGAALMEACIAIARRRGCDGIWLGVWGKNTRAIDFYRQWGFRQVGTQAFVLGNDRQTDLVLWLALDPAAK